MTEQIKTVFDGGVTSFDELSTVEFTPLFELDSANGLSPQYRDKVTETNGATVTASGGELVLTTNTTASAKAVIETQERGRYQPGIEAIAGVAIRRTAAPTGDQQWLAGYYDDNDGYWIGEDATGLFAQMRVGGTDRSKVYQSDWNNGADISLNLKRMTVFRFVFQCYYGGPLRVEVIQVNDQGGADRVSLHRFGSVDDEPILQQSKLPVRAEASNGGTTSSFVVQVGGRHFGVRGRYAPNRRVTAQETPSSVAIGTSYTPLVTLKKKTDSVNQPKSVKINAVNVISDTDSVWALMLNGSVSGASFGEPSNIGSAETALQADTAASSISLTNAIAITKGMVSSNNGSQSSLAGITGLGVDIPDDSEVSLVVKTLSGTGNASGVLGIEEEW